MTWRWLLLALVLKDCWGRKPCNHACLICSIIIWVNCGLRDRHNYNCINNVGQLGQLAPVSIQSPAGIPLGRCSLIEPDLDITERYGVLVGRTLVDASDWSANILLNNMGYDTVVLPSFSYVGDLVPVSVVSVARTVVVASVDNQSLLEHLEHIVTSSHPSLGL